VIATTIRLWWQRHIREPAEPQAKWLRLYRRLGFAALVVALVAVSVTAVNLAGSRSPTQAEPPRHRATASSGPADPAAVVVAAASRQQAATWVAAQVGHGVIVACDPLMCAALQQHGFPVANLAPLSSGTGDPLGSGIVISTDAVRSQLGPRLATVYAPMTIASFGSGPSLIQVRVIAPDGASAYMAAESADVRARQAAGRDMLTNRSVHVPASARGQLTTGQIDLRLLITLAALANKHQLLIRDFGDAGPGAMPDVPLRSVSLISAGSRYLRQVLAFLRSQRAPLLAQTSVQTDGKNTVLTIQFTAPSPMGLLTQN